MFEIRTLLVLLALGSAAAVLASSRRARALVPEGRAPARVRAGILLNTLAMVVVAVVAGTVLAPGAGLAPAGVVATRPNSLASDLGRQVAAGCVGGLGAAAFVLGLYYLVFRPRIAPDDVLRLERVRLRLGLLGRIVQGGVVEEIVFRWGVMTILAWIGAVVTGGRSSPVIWVAIAGASLVFALAHLPGARAMGVERTGALIGTALVVNGGVGLVCGWLYWQHGLLAAILAHAVVHVVWVPLDRRLYQRLEAACRPV